MTPALVEVALTLTRYALTRYALTRQAQNVSKARFPGLLIAKPPGTNRLALSALLRLDSLTNGLLP